jgi:hypothetical protein
MSQFQVKYFDEDDWKEVSEKIVLEKLVDEFGRVTPFLTKMVQVEKSLLLMVFFA